MTRSVAPLKVRILHNARPMIEISTRRRWAVTIGVMTGMLLAALEATVVGTAMPTIVTVLGGLAHYSWAFSRTAPDID